MRKVYYDVPNIAEKFFCELCIRDFVGGGHYEVKMNPAPINALPKDLTWTITTTCEEEDQHMQYVLSLI